MKYNIFGTESGRYDDIIGMKHHVSERHQHMSMHDRAAQFAPFAALTGHGAAIEETANSMRAEKQHLIMCSLTSWKAADRRGYV